MTIFYILLMIYSGLTLMAAVVGFSVCIIAGRVDTLRQRQAKRQALFVALDKPAPETPSVQGKSWVMNVH